MNYIRYNPGADYVGGAQQKKTWETDATAGR